MPEDLWQILYVSRATRPYQEEELLEFLEQFQAFNAAHNITGLLVYGQCCFAQVIEGPRTALQALYERIRADDRHCQVVTMLDRKIYRREFDDWSMAFRLTEHMDAEIHWRWSRFLEEGVELRPRGADMAFSVLEQVRDRIRRSAPPPRLH